MIAPKYYATLKDFDRLDFKTLENTVSAFYMGRFCGYSLKQISELDTGMNNVNDMLRFVYKMGCEIVAEDKSETLGSAMQQGISYYQNYVQVKNWNRRKQVYSFDADMLNELIRTDISDITLPYDAFEHLPYRSLYLDFSANKQIVKTLNADGCLVDIQAVTLPEDKYSQYVVILLSFLEQNETRMIKAQILPNEKGNVKIPIDDIINSDATWGLYVSETGKYPEGVRPELQEFLAIQCLLYLCSYEPDIRETPASKMQYRKVKKDKKNGKQVPVREYAVGERFGEAFRKWTKGCIGQSSEHTPTGRRNKPHMRRAHYHRYWIGKRNSDERQLVTRWVHECLCGLTEDEAEDKLDTIKHKAVKG